MEHSHTYHKEQHKEKQMRNGAKDINIPTLYNVKLPSRCHINTVKVSKLFNSLWKYEPENKHMWPLSSSTITRGKKNKWSVRKQTLCTECSVYLTWSCHMQRSGWTAGCWTGCHTAGDDTLSPRTAAQKKHWRLLGVWPHERHRLFSLGWKSLLVIISELKCFQ